MTDKTERIESDWKEVARMIEITQQNSERKRAMLLAWVDEYERTLGIKPRTSQIRQFWRSQGCPSLDNIA